jgi:hypothetical protein
MRLAKAADVSAASGVVVGDVGFQKSAKLIGTADMRHIAARQHRPKTEW